MSDDVNALAIGAASKIWSLQREMAKMPQVQLPTRHFFADGMYCRFLPRPAGTLIVGKVHKREHFYIVASGTVRVSENDGMTAVEYTAPTLLVSQPGTKRAVLAITDAVCLTIHRLEHPTQDLDAIERELMEDDPTALFDAANEPKELPCPGSQPQLAADR